MRVEPLSAHRHLIPELAASLHREWRALPPWSNVDVIAERLRAASGSALFPYTLVAISESNELLGTASIKLDELPAHSDKKHWLGEVYVSPNHRGRGIATHLTEHLVEYSTRHAVRSLYLYTPDQQALYAKLGWRPLGEERVDNEVVTLMVRHGA